MSAKKAKPARKAKSGLKKARAFPAGARTAMARPAAFFGGAASRWPQAAVAAALPAVRPGPLKALRFANAGLQAVTEGSKELLAAARSLEKSVVATIATRTISGKKVQDYRGQITRDNFREFRLDSSGTDAAVTRMKSLGFEVLSVGRFAITVRGPAALFRDTLKVEMQVSALPHRVISRAEPRTLGWEFAPPNPRALFAAPATGLTVASPGISENVDHFVFIPPAKYFLPAPSATPPTPAYWHLKEAQIRSLLRADAVPQSGQGVKLAVVDTGFWTQHPYYQAKTFSHTHVAPNGSGPADQDSHGHGTGIFLNALAMAPQADFVLVRDQPSAQIAIDAALAQNPRIISCSWGWPYEQSFPTLEATLRSAVLDDGIVVLFAAGNGDMAWPGSMPEVISVGGVYADQDSALEASSYSSGYMSSLYPGRRIPDLSGLVGQHPAGIYIVLPSPPGSEMDRHFGGTPFPQWDETSDTDGWLAASGTSSATPQLAGIVALMLEKNPGLTPQQVKDILTETATPVERGNNALGFPAVGHPNVAVGFGLANAQAAVTAA